MKTLEIKSVEMPDVLRFLRLPGPRSNTVELSTMIDGQARLALTEEPPEPRNVTFNGVPSLI